MAIAVACVKSGRTVPVQWFIASILTLFGASAALAQSTEAWDTVIAAAKKEGQVVAYIPAGSNVTPEVMKRFEAKYGIPVNLVRLPSPPAVRERIRTEQASGHYIGDVVMSGSTIRTIVGLGQVQKHLGLPNLAQIKAPGTDDGYFFGWALLPHAMMVNTTLVPESDRPRSWNDLLDPKWRGKMIADDPRAPGPGNVLWAVLLDVMGRPYLEKLAAQNLTLTGDAPLAARRVAQGEFSALIGLNMTLLYNLQGLPAQGVIPAEGASLVENVASLLKNAPHPNAGRLLLNYLLEEDTQKFIASQGLWSSTGMKSDEVPAILKNIQTVKWAGAVTPEQVDPAIAIFKEILK